MYEKRRRRYIYFYRFCSVTCKCNLIWAILRFQPDIVYTQSSISGSAFCSRCRSVYFSSRISTRCNTHTQSRFVQPSHHGHDICTSLSFFVCVDARRLFISNVCGSLLITYTDYIDVMCSYTIVTLFSSLACNARPCVVYRKRRVHQRKREHHHRVDLILIFVYYFKDVTAALRGIHQSAN